ncbi:hypothetical protein Emed_005810 [Eimeria media]
MDFRNTSSLADLVSPPAESEALQAFRSHSRETRLSSRLSLLALIVACSVVVFLVSSCASRLRLTGARTTRRLAESGEEEPLLPGACSNDLPGTSESEGFPPTTSSAAASQGSSNPEESESSQRRRHYDFRRIDSENNRRALRKLMDSMYRWRLPHPGLSTKKCSIQLGNVVLKVKAEELRKHMGWPHHRHIRDAGRQLEEFLLRTREELLRAGARKFSTQTQLGQITNGFLVKEEGRSGNEGLLQIFVDDLPEDEEEEGASSPQPPGAQPEEEPPQPELREPSDPGLFAYNFPRIPGQDRGGVCVTPEPPCL